MALLAAAVLIMLNMGWLLSAKAMLEQRRRLRERDTPPTEIGGPR
ncbi:MAG: hypothetical protein U0821_21795 [Chloroflexota bacterium]